MDDYQPIFLALVDAAKNCEEAGALATLTLRSGATVIGKLDRPRTGSHTAHVRRHDGGWTTALIAEIAAVSASPPVAF